MLAVQSSSNRVGTSILSKVGTTVMWCGAVQFYSTFLDYTQSTSGKIMFKGMLFYAASSKQPLAKLANRDPVAVHKVAGQSEREWLSLLITGEIKCPSTDVVVSRAGVACKATVYCTHAP